MSIDLLVCAVCAAFPTLLFPGTCLSLCNNKYTNRKLFCLAFAIFFGICGYLYRNPMQDPDIVYYIKMAKEYADIPFLQCFDRNYTGLYAFDIWFWIVAKIGDYQLIPAMATFVVYLIQAYIITDYHSQADDDEFDVYPYALLAIIFIINFNTVVNGIRNYISFSFFLLAIYRDYIQQKKNLGTLFFYILACLFHIAAYSLILIRLFMIVYKRFKNQHLIWFMAFPLLFHRILSYLLEFVQIPFLRDILARLDMYYNWNEGGYVSMLQNSFSAKLMKILFLAIVILFLFLLLQKKEKDLFDTFCMIYLLVSLMTFTFSTAIYGRFMQPFICFGGIVLMRYEHKDSRWFLFTQICMLGFFLVGCLLNIHQINVFMGAAKYFLSILLFPFSVIKEFF